MNDLEYSNSVLPEELLAALRARPRSPEFPQFHPEWLERAPKRLVAVRGGGVLTSPVRRLQVALVAAVLFAFGLGAIVGTTFLRPTADGYSEIVRLRNGVRLRGKVVNVVGPQVVVETQDSVYVIDSKQVRSLNYGRNRNATTAYRRDFPDREVIELSNGLVLRGRIINQLGEELLVETAGESFTLNRSEVRKIKYLAEAGAAKQ